MNTTFLGNLFSSSKQDKAQATDMAKAMAVQQIYVAIFAHENWKHRILNFAEGCSTEAFTAEEVYAVEGTELGQWIETVGKTKFGAYTDFALLVEHHKMLHYAAANSVFHIEMHPDEVSRNHEVKQLLTGPFENFSNAIISDLLKLRETVEGEDGDSHSAKVIKTLPTLH